MTTSVTQHERAERFHWGERRQSERFLERHSTRASDSLAAGHEGDCLESSVTEHESERFLGVECHRARVRERFLGVGAVDELRGEMASVERRASSVESRESSCC